MSAAQKSLTHFEHSSAYIPDVVFTKSQIKPSFKYAACRGLGYLLAAYDIEQKNWIGFVNCLDIGFDSAKDWEAAQNKV